MKGGLTSCKLRWTAVLRNPWWQLASASEPFATAQACSLAGDKSTLGATEQSGTIWSSPSLSTNTSLLLYLAPAPKKSDVGRCKRFPHAVDILYFLVLFNHSNVEHCERAEPSATLADLKLGAAGKRRLLVFCCSLAPPLRWRTHRSVRLDTVQQPLLWRGKYGKKKHFLFVDYSGW